MASRSQLVPLSKNKTPTADDINLIYYILNGSYTNSNRVGGTMGQASRGLGMPIRLTAFDGRMSTGLVDTTSYALDVRNRETTQQRALAVRRADGTIAFVVEGGKAYAPLNTGSSTSGEVLVNGSTAGGVLTGTYPDPGFYLAAESYVFRPGMIMEWYGSNATVLVAGNLELQDAPGWVLCAGQTVTMRDSSSVVVPDMRDRYPIGAGGTYALGATAGNSLSGQQSISIAHGHSIAHTHSHDHAHEHTVPDHAHSHTHLLNNHVHSIATHTHGLGNHTHSGASHTHPGSHSHGLANHHHAGQSHTHPGSHSHGMVEHRHQFGHHHTVNNNTADNVTNNLRTVSPEEADASAKSHGHGNTTDQNTASTTGDGETTAGGSVFTSTQPDTNAPSASYSGSPSDPSPNSSDPDTNAPAASYTGATGASSGNTDGSNSANTDPNNDASASALTAATTGTCPTDSKTSSVDATGATPATTSSQTSLTSINAQPPTTALWFIFKL